MIQEIKYSGITTSPSEYDCPDGDVASMMNLVNEKGNLMPVTPPKTLITLKSGQKVLYIHKTSNYCNYIVHDTSNEGNNICYFTESSTLFKEITSLAEKELYQINSIGNTLVILTSQGLIYGLFSSGNYEILGSNPPFPAISFRLRGGVGEIKSFTVKFDRKTRFYKEVNIGYMGVKDRLALDNPITSNTIYANISPAAETFRNAGKFQYDFMIRYAYRLYDDSLYMSSVPIYMNAGNGTPFFAKIEHFYNYADDDGTDNMGKYILIHKVDIKLHSIASLLYYQITNTDEIIKERDKWKDLIKELVFFITPPLYYMDQSFQPPHATKIIEFNSGVGTINTQFTLSIGKSFDQYVYYEGEYPRYYWDRETRVIPLMIKRSGDEGIYAFYQVASIKLSSIQSGEQLLPIESGALSNLSSRELMTGDSNMSHRLVPHKSFVYNSRLNLVNVSTIPQEYPLESCVAYINGKVGLLSASEIILRYAIETYSFKAYVFIKSSNTDVLIIETSSLPLYSLGKFFFYPDMNAFRVIVERTDTDGNKAYSSSKLEKHEYLNGAYTASLSESYQADFDMSIINGTDRGFYYPNKIYTSEVNNPFTFPDSGVNDIGTGEIMDIRSATKALSQGQFGQFPLYAFTSEGIWALEVANDGSFSSKQPITRDVCNNPGSITQIDTAVLFTSERGIMLIQGSESICISDILNDKSFDVSTLKGADQLVQMAGFKIGHFKHSRFLEYIKDCNMAYDYMNQRIVVFNKKYLYAYVWSIQYKTWSMIASNFDSVVNSYPDSYIMTNENTLVNISNTNDGNLEKNQGIIITRPIKLGSADLFKTVDSCIHRGTFANGHVKTAIYGSRDLINWYLISSSKNHYLRGFRGTPFKYFRFVIITEFDSGESLSGTSISFNYRQNNKLR